MPHAKFRTSDATDKIDAALAKAQAKIHAAEKDAENPHFKSRFASLNSIVAACKDALAEVGVARVQIPYTDGEQVGVTTRLACAGQFYEGDLSTKPAQAGPQALGSVISYLKRYALAAMCGVAIGDDDDAEAAEGRDFKAGGKAKPDPKASGDAAEKVREALVPRTPEARKANLKARMKAMGIEGARMAEQLGEWIGRVVDGSTVLTADDWSRADTAIEQAKQTAATLGRAQDNGARAAH